MTDETTSLRTRLAEAVEALRPLAEKAAFYGADTHPDARAGAFSYSQAIEARRIVAAFDAQQKQTEASNVG